MEFTNWHDFFDAAKLLLNEKGTAVVTAETFGLERERKWRYETRRIKGNMCTHLNLKTKRHFKAHSLSICSNSYSSCTFSHNHENALCICRATLRKKLIHNFLEIQKDPEILTYQNVHNYRFTLQNEYLNRTIAIT